MSEILDALKEIEDLRVIHNLRAEQVYTLRILRIMEIEKQDYKSMKEYFIKLNSAGGYLVNE
jgi:hypothetical protein